MREGTHVRRHDPGGARHARYLRPRLNGIHAARHSDLHPGTGRGDGRPGHEFDTVLD
jgi:hypothetical protein